MNPKHKQDTKSPEFLIAEAQDYQAFLDGKPSTLRGRHHKRAAQSIVRVQEIGYRVFLARQSGSVAA